MFLLLQAICHIHGFLLGLSDHFLGVDVFNNLKKIQNKATVHVDKEMH